MNANPRPQLAHTGGNVNDLVMRGHFLLVSSQRALERSGIRMRDADDVLDRVRRHRPVRTDEDRRHA